jgi:hypothetical protein
VGLGHGDGNEAEEREGLHGHRELMFFYGASGLGLLPDWVTKY